MKKICLLAIDCQMDFCSPKGALYVPGADKDMQRLAAMVGRYEEKISRIYASLDCHHLISVFLPGMWVDSEKNNPDPFTIITAKDIKNEKWLPVLPNLKQRFIDYCEELEKIGEELIIWPQHCLIGSKGNALFPILFKELEKWQYNHRMNVSFITKSSNPFTEMYSMFQAKVPAEDDRSTQLNTNLIKSIEEHDEILVAGEAGSHCTLESVRDLSENFNNKDSIKKIIWLKDCISPVQSPNIDFLGIQQKFIEEMKEKGMRVAKSTDFN
jgi:nicotinamidase/pyrazinamidase